MKRQKNIAIALFCVMEINTNGAINQSETQYATTIKSTPRLLFLPAAASGIAEVTKSFPHFGPA